MENYQFVIKEYEHDHLGIGNVLKCLITALSINDDVKIVCAPEYRYGNYDTILDDRLIYDPAAPVTKEIVRVNTCRFLLLYYEESLQEDLPNEETSIDPIHPTLFHWYFTLRRRIDWHYDPKRVHPQVRTRILEAMDKIHWKPIVMDTVSLWHSAFSSQVALGISVRTWRATHESNIQRPYSAEIYKNQIDIVMREHPEIQTIVLSVDCSDAVSEYVTYLSLHYPSRSLVLLSPLPHLNPIQYAVTKAFTLSKCAYLIGNRISTFTELVYWFGRCQPIVYPVF
jgi:hypothetical protein